MQVNFPYKLGAVGIIVTLLMVCIHPLLPERRLTFFPASDMDVDAYSDQLAGGASRASWISRERMHWRCDVKEGAAHRFCGIHIYVFPGGAPGVDLSHYDSIKVQLLAKTSDSRVRIYLRNFEEGLSREGVNESMKFINVLVPLSDLTSELTIDLREFAVAEWWINENNVPRGRAYPRFNDVRAIGIDLGVPPSIGVHELELKSLVFVGSLVSAAQWYRGILLAWVGIFLLLSLVRYVHLKRRYLREQERLRSLEQSTNELETESEKFRELSYTDNLTGALNRHGFDQLLTQLRSGETADDLFALLLLDLDLFKKVNDERGHDVGDQVLVGTANTVTAVLAPDQHLIRWGGEEFVILARVGNEESAAHLAEKTRLAVAGQTLPIDPPLCITTSVGFDCFRLSDDFESVFKRVDQAVYIAKSNGRNCVSRATEASDRDAFSYAVADMSQTKQVDVKTEGQD